MTIRYFGNDHVRTRQLAPDNPDNKVARASFVLTRKGP